MWPRVSVSRLKSKRLSRPSKSTRALERATTGTDEYFLRSWVLDELNKAVRPIRKDMYILRKTLYEEKREMINRIGLLEDDVGKITSILTSDRFGRNPKRWMSRSSIDPSTASSVDNVNEISEISSPAMIDVQKLEFHLQRNANKSDEDLTQQGEAMQHAIFNCSNSQTFIRGVNVHQNLSGVLNHPNKRSWQSSQSMDTGLDLIPSEPNGSPMMYLRKLRTHSSVDMVPSYSKNPRDKGSLNCKEVGSSHQSIIDEESKENEDPSGKSPEKRRLVTVDVDDDSFSRKRFKWSGIAETQKRTIKPLNDYSIDGGEQFLIGSKVNVEASRGKEVEGNIFDAERRWKDVNMLVQHVEGRHRKFSDTYTKICNYIKQREGKTKLSSEDFNTINTGLEKFLGLLEKAKSGILSEADAKLAQNLQDDIEAMDAKIQALDSIEAMKEMRNPEGEYFKKLNQNEIPQDMERTILCDDMKSTVPVQNSIEAMKEMKNPEGEHFEKLNQNEIPQDMEITILCDEMKSTVPVQRRVYCLEKKTQDSRENRINIPGKEFDKNSADTTNTNMDNISILKNRAGRVQDLRELLNEKRSNSLLKQNKLLHEEELQVNNKNSTVSVESMENASHHKRGMVSIECVVDYQSLLKNYKKVEELLADFSKDNSLRQIRVDCQKTLNLILNTITAQRASHLLDKYKTLSKFLNNETVIISEKPITASLHPQGALYSLNYLAMKTVKQGELCVSYNPEAAYAIASVAVALWTDMPQFGKLLLYHLYQASPYLIPTYWERRHADEEQYYKVGFLHQNSEDDLEQFLKRQSGIMRLYSAIIVTPHKTANKSKPHPLPLSEAWHWLTTTLALPPKPDVSATLLLNMLEVTGHMLALNYKAQFWKMMNFINDSYCLSIEEVTPAGRGGPLSRLRAFLEVVLTGETVPPPKGILPPDFW